MSQGGQIAPIAAAISEKISFVVSLSGSAVPLRSQLIYEENHNLRYSRTRWPILRRGVSSTRDSESSGQRLETPTQSPIGKNSMYRRSSFTARKTRMCRLPVV